MPHCTHAVQTILKDIVWSVCLLSVIKMAEPIVVPFGVWTWDQRTMYQVEAGSPPPPKGAFLGDILWNAQAVKRCPVGTMGNTSALHIARFIDLWQPNAGLHIHNSCTHTYTRVRSIENWSGQMEKRIFVTSSLHFISLLITLWLRVKDIAGSISGRGTTMQNIFWWLLCCLMLLCSMTLL